MPLRFQKQSEIDKEQSIPLSDQQEQSQQYRPVLQWKTNQLQIHLIVSSKQRNMDRPLTLNPVQISDTVLPL